MIQLVGAGTVSGGGAPSGTWAEYAASDYALSDLASVVTDWADTSGNARDAVLHGTGVYRTNQVAGQPAIDFTTNFNYFTLPTMAAFTEGTAYFVVKADLDPNFDSNGALHNMGSDASNHNHYPFSDGVIYDGWGTPTRDTSFDPTPLLNKWHLFAVRILAGVKDYFIDGVNVSSAACTAGFNSAPAIGNSGGFFFRGRIAHVLIFDTGRSETERTTIDEPYLVGLYPITEFWGQTIGIKVFNSDASNSDGRLLRDAASSGFFQCGAYSANTFVRADGKRLVWAPTVYAANSGCGLDTRAFNVLNLNYAVLYGFAMFPDSTHLQLLENISGTPTEVGTTTWTPGDVFELQVDPVTGAVSHVKNGSVLVTSSSTIGSGVPIWASGSIYNNGEILENVNVIPL